MIRVERGDDFILDLIDTPEFQRLRRVRQLGVSWLTYPGAEHSRFVHSLGVFNFAQRILEVLIRRYEGNKVATYLNEHSRIAKAAALLHDIGHGPFSHMIERAFGKKSSHEARTVEIIKDEDSDVGRVLRNHEVDPASVADLIQHTSPHTLLTDLVTSQLDADRMDYLLRDSHATGVQYGHYDAEWLLNAMCIGRNPQDTASDEEHRRWRLALDERRGIKAAEQFILARAHMNEQVYFHRVTRGFEALLLNIFRLAASAAKADKLPTETPTVVKRYFASEGQIEAKDWLRFDESMIFSALHVWADQTSGNDALPRLSSAFLHRERVYQSALIPNDFSPMRTPELYDRLTEVGLQKGVNWSPDDAKSAAYKDIHYTMNSARGSEEETRIESILLSSGKPSSGARLIESSSDLLKHLAGQRQSFVRIYFDRSMRSEAEVVLKEFKLSIESPGANE